MFCGTCFVIVSFAYFPGFFCLSSYFEQNPYTNIQSKWIYGNHRGNNKITNLRRSSTKKIGSALQWCHWTSLMCNNRFSEWSFETHCLILHFLRSIIQSDTFLYISFNFIKLFSLINRYFQQLFHGHACMLKILYPRIDTYMYPHIDSMKSISYTYITCLSLI